MFIMKNREYCEKLGKFEETKEKPMKSKMEEDLNKQIFNHDFKKVFASSIHQQKGNN